MPPRRVARAAASAASASRLALSPSEPPFADEFDVGSLVELDVVVAGSVTVVGEPAVSGALTVCGLPRVCEFCRVADFSEAPPCGLLVSSDVPLPVVVVVGELFVIGGCATWDEVSVCGFSGDALGAAFWRAVVETTDSGIPIPTAPTGFVAAFANDDGAEAPTVGSVE
jgi:hypothetical protein